MFFYTARAYLLIKHIMKKYKTYYNTTEIMEMYNISERTIRYRIATLSKKYKGQPTLISKRNNKWRVHHSITEYFAPKRNNN